MESAHHYFRIGAPLILDWAHRLTGIRTEDQLSDSVYIYLNGELRKI